MQQPLLRPDHLWAEQNGDGRDFWAVGWGDRPLSGATPGRLEDAERVLAEEWGQSPRLIWARESRTGASHFRIEWTE